MNKKETILNAALGLFVRDGFHGTPTSKIANEAGVSNGTLFHYYATKEELIIALYNDIKTELSVYLSSNIHEGDSLESSLKKSFIYSLYWALEHPSKFYYIQQIHFSPFLAKISRQAIEEQTRFHLDLIEQGIQAKLIKSLPVDLLFTLISSHIYGLFQYLSDNEFTADKQKTIIEDCFNLIWQMIKA